MKLKPISSPIVNETQQYDTSSLIEVFKQMLELTETKNQEDRSLVLTVKEAAEELQVSIPTLRDHFLCKPDFPKIRAGSKILIPRKSFEEWINGQR
jgi:excisionase family DNA binding protein